MIRVLLIRIYQPCPLHVLAPPIGLMSIAAFLRDYGNEKYEVKIVDMNLSRMKPDEIGPIIRDFDPAITGLSALSFERPAMHAVARLVKGLKPECKVTVGGPYGTSSSEEVLENPCVDWVIIGEGEITFSELLDTYFGNGNVNDVPGIAFRQNNQAVYSPHRDFISDLDRLPFPAWDLIDIPAYSLNVPNMNAVLAAKPYMHIFTSRGCPFHCIYCHDLMGKSIREMSPQKVLEQIRILYSRNKVKEIHIVDDCFNYHPERAKEICRKINEEGIKIKIAFPNGIRADLCDNELLTLLKISGTYMISFAVETASERLQILIKKNLNLEKVRETINQCNDLGFITKGYFMIGFPSETIEEIQKTVNFAVKSSLLFASFFFVVPFRNTPLFELSQREYPGLQFEDYDKFYHAGTSFYKCATGIDLNKIQRNAYLKFYFSGRFFRIIRKSFLKYDSFQQIFISFIKIYLDKLLKILNLLPFMKSK